jgi:Cyclic nucleotide-binding domain
MPIIRRSNLILPRLRPQVTAKLLACAFKRAVKAGEALFVAGERGDGCYRIEQGLVKIIVASARGEQRIIALVGGGEIVGELALIDHQPRSASAIAIHDSTSQSTSAGSRSRTARKTMRRSIGISRRSSRAGCERPTRRWRLRASYPCEGALPARYSNSRNMLARPWARGAFCSASASAGAIRRGTRERQRCLERFEEVHARHALLEFLHTQRYRST